MNPTALTVLGDRYTLTELIATGGMGEVWSAEDSVLRRTVAVKLLSPALGRQSGFLQRFRAEAQHAAALHHPNITTVFDYGEDGGTAYLVMELVAGQPLSKIISEHAPLSTQETTSILVQAATALEAAHQGGVVHRDVKPANILITSDGTVKLTDFGISRLVDTAPLTQTGQVLGTAQYISPEQALGQSATAASDIYALGVVGQEMLTGQRPFDAGNSVATALAHINQPPPPLPDTIPLGIRDVISACLAKSPADRPGSAAAMAHALGTPALDLATQVVDTPAGTQKTQVMATAGMQTERIGLPDQGISDQGISDQGMPDEGMPDQGEGRPGRRSIVLLAVAATAALGVFAAVALSSSTSGVQAPRPARPTTANTTTANTTHAPTSVPTTRAAIVTPPTIIAPIPRQPPAGKGHKKKGKQ